MNKLQNYYLTMFISTRHYDNLTYRHIVLGSLQKTKQILKLKKIDFLYFRIIKKPSLKYYCFLIQLVLFGNIFSKNRANIKYENILVGRYALAETFKNFETYLSKIKFYLFFIINLYYAGKLIYSAKEYEKRYRIKAIYIDHCCYLNGVLYSYFSLKKKIVYSNNYPSNLYGIDFRKKKNVIFRNYEESIKIKKGSETNKINFNFTDQFAKKMFKKKNFIPWMSTTKFVESTNIDFSLYDYIVYAHSFTDGQLFYGYDGFENVFDWLSFTLDELSKTNKKILVKAHPNFYRKTHGIQSIYDNKIFSILEKKYKKNPNIFILNKPIFNNKILRKISKDAILISHHGTVLLEGSFYNFKSICSQSTFFNKNFKISNTWKNKSEYKYLLNKDFKKLSHSNKKDILYLIYMIFLDDKSYSGKKFWSNIIQEACGIKSHIEWQKKIEIFSNTKNINQRYSLLKKLIKDKDEEIIKKISQNIVEY